MTSHTRMICVSFNCVFSKLRSSSLESVVELLYEVLVVTTDETLLYVSVTANEAVDIRLSQEFGYEHVVCPIRLPGPTTLLPL
jgi:hypothetical protein